MSNVGILKSSPSYSQATAFIAEINTQISNPFAETTCFPATEVLDDFTDSDDVTVKTSNQSNNQSPESSTIDFQDDYMDSDDATMTYPERPLNDDEAELLRWHL